MLPTNEVISSSCVGDNKYLPPLRSCSLKSSELLLSNLPDFFHRSSDEKVDNESFDAPNKYVD